jgi:hypothetical protein
MITRFGSAASGVRPYGRVTGVFLILAASILTVACDSVPLLAPSGSTITLTASTNAIPANGTAQLIAYVLEASGTPPHPGTQVIFTTSLGVIEPAEATTDVNGRAVATFRANGNNGIATINAASGGATTGGTTGGTNGGTAPPSTGAVRISVGTAAVGRITLAATPSTISANGGSSTVTANVVDINGNALGTAPVSFSTSAGSLSTSLVNTDSNGNAQTTLTTSVEAIVTATVGVAGGGGTGTGGDGAGAGGGSTSGQGTATITVRVNPSPTVTVAAQGTTFTVGSPVTFTVTVALPTGSTGQIRDVRMTFGDGDSASLGAAIGTIPVQHLYEEERTYSVSARATDSLGGVGEGGTVIVVQGQVPVVNISFSRQDLGASWDYTFVANVFPAGTTIVSYSWNFGDGTSSTTGLNTVNHTYTKGSPQRTVTVTVTRPNGQQATSSTTITP